MPTILERAGKMLRGEAPPPPVGRLLGFVLKAVEPGRAWSNGLATTTWPTSGTAKMDSPADAVDWRGVCTRRRINRKD